MKRSKSLLMLISLLIGGMQTAKSEVIVPALSEFTMAGDGSNLVEYGGNVDKITQDLNCSAGNYYMHGQKGSLLVWACIDALSDSVGSSSVSNSSASSTDNATTSNLNRLGEGVASSTALTTALTALPQTSKESKLSCGVGTGAYSSKYAVGFGCASKLNERVDVNAGGSYVFGGSKSYGGGTLDSSVFKAGFVFKLGALNKPTQISFKDKKIIDKQISILQEDNKNLKEEVEVSKAKNEEIISLNQKLLARLEKLENIALKFQSNSEMISIAAKE